MHKTHVMHKTVKFYHNLHASNKYGIGYGITIRLKTVWKIISKVVSHLLKLYEI